MPYLEESLLKKKEELETLIAKVERSKYRHIKGQIKVKKTMPISIQYRRTKEEPYKFLRKNEHKTAYAIAQRDYETSLLYHARKQLDGIKKLLNNYQPKELGDIYTSMNPVRKTMINPYVLSDEDYAKIWLSQKSTSHNSYQKAYPYYTLNGEHVRSKSEQIIADRLFTAGIPYRYEYPVDIDSYTTFYPDFMVLNKKTRRVYILEHLGLFDNPEYMRNNFNKLTQYQRAGYLQGEALLFTAEVEGKGLDIEVLNKIIEHYFT